MTGQQPAGAAQPQQPAGAAQPLWPAGAATGIGSLPGTDPAEAVRMVFGELPDLPFLPELPARGPGADMVGRSAGLLTELPVEVYSGRWKLTGRPGRDLRRARELMLRDLDALHEHAAEYDGVLKLQVAGPWTLAATLELPLGGRALRDHGAAREIAESLADGVRRHVAEVAARLPRARLLLQIDEPSLPSVLAGRVATDSGLYTYRSVDVATARAALAEVVTAAGVPVVAHCCASDVPVALLREAGAAALAIDLALVTDLDPLGEALDAGTALVAGAADPRLPAPSSAEVATRIRDVWQKLGFPLAAAAAQVAVSPACGLAGADGQAARAVLAACRDAARRLLDA
jgi:methionine synthase II (cobalamin-independent)